MEFLKLLESDVSIILGSNSPRRKYLLEGLGLRFKVSSSNADEDFPSHLKAEKIPMFLAEKKSRESSHQT